MSLIDNPIEWAKSGIGTKKGFWITVIGHIVVGIFIVVRYSTRGLPLVLFSTVFPIMYLYAMKILLEELKELDQNNKGRNNT